MALVGLSLVLASVVWVVFSRPPFLQRLFASLWSPQIDQPPPRDGGAPRPREASSEKEAADDDEKAEHAVSSASSAPKTVTPAPPAVAEPASQTTPKAPASQPSPNNGVPSFSLSSSPPASAAALARSSAASMPPPAPPTFSAPKLPDPTFSTPAGSASSMMPPPPRPPTLNNLNPAATSRAANSSNLAAPNSFARSARQPGSSTLAPPPSHSSKPAKPSRKVMLEPGHSPLDWARLAQAPTSDLRNLPAGTPYLKVTPSRLKTMTGRRGKDAWTALGGRVYNITPYVAFHPGGGPELLRVAGRDGTRLFGEIHPWVNYEGMLASCMIGMLVEEGEEKKNEMDDMD
ncbi:cytochrome b5-like Heme/Steroid binding domain-containing protein [Apiospora kogelbergensis]|uniref:Cytochrome b5-like Heme/Steroid binding domain-containing protein n=1 Tax=Apiospora kogelbergensis TaxID=1337665 RepID=A0AAW0RAK6_9PEZI